MSGTVFTTDGLRARGVKPHFFGLGFIQAKLSETERLHFYHPSLVANVPEEELHDHRYDFESAVIAGKLTNEIWTFRPDQDGPHELVKVSCEPGTSAAHIPPVRGEAAMSLRFETVAGARYLITHDQFHRVWAESCITHITRKPKVKDLASVIRGSGAEAVCPFGVSLSEDACWEIIAEMLGEAQKPGYHLRDIPRGTLGEASKIFEEVEEFRDALTQGVSVMAILELADLQGAVRAWLETHHPSVTLADLVKMSDVTRRAFENGHRG